MSERSRGPEGASSPSTTQGSPSAGDDIYAAAAASAAGRTARRGGANRPARSAGSAPEAEAESTATAARARTNGQGSGDQASGDHVSGSKSSAGQGSGKTSSDTTGKDSAGKDSTGKASAAGNGDQAPKAAEPKTADSESSTESTSKFGAVASSVLNRVRPGSKGDAEATKAESKPASSPASANSNSSGTGTSGSTQTSTEQAPAKQSGKQTGEPSGKQSADKPANTAQPAAAAATGAAVGAGSANASADPAAEPTTALPREQLLPAGGTTTAAPAKAEKHKAGTAKGTRKARLRLSRLDPWSVMKTAFLFSIAAGIVMVVAVYAVWLVIGSSGLFSSLDSIVGSVLQSPGDSTPFKVEDYINTQKVMGVTAFLACIDVVIFTALATLASFLYNLAATMLGGLEVTLAED